MTLTLELAPEIERALEEKAERAGVPLTDYAARLLTEDAAQGVAQNGATNGANGQNAPEKPRKTPAEIRREIAALSIDYGVVETASVDHDKILYGEGYGR